MEPKSNPKTATRTKTLIVKTKKELRKAALLKTSFIVKILVDIESKHYQAVNNK